MPRSVTVVSKRGCHLCEKVIAAVRALSVEYDLEVKVLDINDDRALHDRYWLTIPVVQLDGKDVLDANGMSPGFDYAGRLEMLLGEGGRSPRSSRQAAHSRTRPSSAT